MYDFGNNSITAKPVTGLAPFVISIMPDSSKYYVMIHGSTLSVVDINKKDVTKLINFTSNYDPMTGKIRRPIEGLQIIQMENTCLLQYTNRNTINNIYSYR
jgi:hypothetical protein